MDLQMVATPFEFLEKVGVFVGLGGAALGNAELKVSGTMLADVLIGCAEQISGIRGQFGEDGKDDALTIRAEDDDCGFHCSVLSDRQNRHGHDGGRESFFHSSEGFASFGVNPPEALPFYALYFPASCAAFFVGKLLHFSAACAAFFWRVLYFSAECCIFPHSNQRSNQVCKQLVIKNEVRDSFQNESVLKHAQRGHWY
jgi:hypothetical protein